MTQIKKNNLNTLDKILSNQIHSNDEIKKILLIRKKIKNKSSKFVNVNLKEEKYIFINHYNVLFNNGASEFPGILELYSLFKNKIIFPKRGKGYFFKMAPEDAELYGTDI